MLDNTTESGGLKDLFAELPRVFCNGKQVLYFYHHPTGQKLMSGRE